MLKPLLTFLVCLFMGCTGYGQVQLRVGERNVNVGEAGLRYLFTDSTSYSNATVIRLLQKEWKPFSNAVRISYQPNVLWLKIPLGKLASVEAFDLLQIDNPHLNELRCWIVRSGELLDSFPLTGDHHVFSTRPVPTAGFVFPLKDIQNRNDTILLAIEKRSSKLDVPLVFYSQEDFDSSLQQSYLRKGILCGLFLLLIFFNFLLFVSSREWVYAWYGLYLASVLLYFVTDAGLLFQFVYPQYPELNDLIRPFAFAFSLIPLLLFFNQLLAIKQNYPRIYQVNKYVLFVYLFIFAAALSTSITGDYSVQEQWLHVNSILSPVILLLVLAEAVYFVKQQVRFAWFALLSFVSFTVFITIFSLGQNGMIPETFFVLHAHYFGVLLDSLIVAVSLIWRYYSFRDDAARLQQEYLLQQKQIFAETSSWQKQQMQTFSSLLHDNVGAHLGFLRLKVDKMQLNEEGRKEVAALVTALGSEVRHMSHQFSPLQLQDKGLYGAAEEMVQHVRSDSSIALQFEWLGNRQSLDLQYELLVYRILQELFQNLLKHSQATEAILQIIQEEQLFGIYLEDNGVGAPDLSDEKKGIGLRTIEQMMKLLKGRFSISSATEKGFSISIEFPIIT